MKIIYQFNTINRISNLLKGDKIRIIDGNGGDTGNVFFLNYYDNKLIFAYQMGYLPFEKYLKANADYKTIQIFKL